MEMADIVTSLPKNGCGLKRCSRCWWYRVPAKAGPGLFVWCLLWLVGARFDSESASFPSSRLFGDQRDDDLSVDDGLWLVVVIGWLSCGIPIWLHVTGCRGTLLRTASHLELGRSCSLFPSWPQARLPLCTRRRCGVWRWWWLGGLLSQPAVVAVTGVRDQYALRYC